MEGSIMADLRASGLGGVPKGATADRPSSPSIGDVFYNGTLGCLEIYTSQGWVANSAPPGIPTIGTVTYSATGQAYNNASASVAFTAGEGGGLPNSYRATSSPGGFTGTASTSPITVSGLQSATAYTFSVTGTNNFGTSAGSTNSNSITANTIPQTPTSVIAVAGNTNAVITFTAGATGGAATTYTVTSSPGSLIGTGSSPVTVSGLTNGTAYTFVVTSTNDNGSASSSASNSITPYVPPVVTGGTLTSDATYYYRTFTSAGTLAVSGSNLNADILVVAGGGGGGAGFNTGLPIGGGGGGAGGLIGFTGQTLIPANYSVTISGGGSGGPGYSASGSNGSPSQFGSLTNVLGGGGGVNRIGAPAGNGGSGGGTALDSGAAGTGTSGQGNNGGTSGVRGAAGGGGKTAVGGSGTGNTGGAGGAGTVDYSSWASATSTGLNGYYAGGGGGGSGFDGSNAFGSAAAGGVGGGGAGRGTSYGAGSNATATTGGGGGGGAGSASANPDVPGGNGAAGIVIIRYLQSAVA